MARTFSAIASQHPGVLAQVLGDVFAWVEFLPVHDRELFAVEFAKVAAGSADLDNYAPLTQLVIEWRATAEIHADPELARHLRQPVEAVGGLVPRPQA